ALPRGAWLSDSPSQAISRSTSRSRSESAAKAAARAVSPTGSSSATADAGSAASTRCSRASLRRWLASVLRATAYNQGSGSSGIRSSLRQHRSPLDEHTQGLLMFLVDLLEPPHLLSLCHNQQRGYSECRATADKNRGGHRLGRLVAQAIRLPCRDGARGAKPCDRRSAAIETAHVDRARR